jgi:hypothetical protein
MIEEKTQGGSVEPQTILNGRDYRQNPSGQIVRVDPGGRVIPRIRISKKERLRLRGKLHNIKEMDSRELADGIIENTKFIPTGGIKNEELLNAGMKAGVNA